jgi:hypothetical protein
VACVTVGSQPGAAGGVAGSSLHPALGHLCRDPRFSPRASLSRQSAHLRHQRIGGIAGQTATANNPPPATCSATIAYDDATRTVTRPTCRGLGEPVTETYDAHFFRVAADSVTYTVFGTFQVCK